MQFLAKYPLFDSQSDREFTLSYGVGLIETYRDIFTIVTIYVELAYNSSNFVIIYVSSIFLR